ncbi:MAG: preprotein translocase subunit TatC [Phycisphaerales bacterium]|nr:preprotein translocase subunit TatC [Phycisphaerales bacterium]
MTEREVRPGGLMSFGDHLDDLRKRVFLAVIVPVPLMLALFFFAAHVRMLLCAPLMEAMRANNLPAQLTVLSPIETITTDLKISLIGALVIAAPWVLWQLWKFISPGLYQHEQRFVRLLLPGSGVLAIVGLALLYWVMLPLMLTVLVSFSVPPTTVLDANPTPRAAASSPTLQALAVDPALPHAGESWINTTTRELRIAIPLAGEPGRVEIASIALEHPGPIVSAFRLSEYLDFVLLFAMCFALAFQLPIALLLLSWVGIVNPKMLRKNRRYALFGVVIVAAAVAPGDLLSLVVVAIPLYLLFEFSIWLIVMAPPSRVASGGVLSKFGERWKESRSREGNVGDE